MPTAKFFVPELDSHDAEPRLVQAVLDAGIYGAVANHRDRCLEIDFEDDEVRIDDVVAAAARAGFNIELVS